MAASLKKQQKRKKMDMKKIKSPADIKKLTLAELNTLCGELREFC